MRNLILLAGIILVSCSHSAPNATVTFNNMAKEEEEWAASVFAVFEEAGQPLLGKWAKDVRSIEVERYNTGFLNSDGSVGCSDYRCQMFGWEKALYIKVRIVEQPSMIPPDLNAAGHTLHFFIGGGNQPGFTTTKFPELTGAQQIEAFGESGDSFKPVPKFLMLF